MVLHSLELTEYLKLRIISQELKSVGLTSTERRPTTAIARVPMGLPGRKTPHYLLDSSGDPIRL